MSGMRDEIEMKKCQMTGIIVVGKFKKTCVFHLS